MEVNNEIHFAHIQVSAKLNIELYLDMNSGELREDRRGLADSSKAECVYIIGGMVGKPYIQTRNGKYTAVIVKNYIDDADKFEKYKYSEYSLVKGVVLAVYTGLSTGELMYLCLKSIGTVEVQKDGVAENILKYRSVSVADCIEKKMLCYSSNMQFKVVSEDTAMSIVECSSINYMLNCDKLGLLVYGIGLHAKNYYKDMGGMECLVLETRHSLVYFNTGGVKMSSSAILNNMNGKGYLVKNENGKIVAFKGEEITFTENDLTYGSKLEIDGNIRRLMGEVLTRVDTKVPVVGLWSMGVNDIHIQYGISSYNILKGMASINIMIGKIPDTSVYIDTKVADSTVKDIIAMYCTIVLQSIIEFGETVFILGLIPIHLCNDTANINQFIQEEVDACTDMIRLHTKNKDNEEIDIEEEVQNVKNYVVRQLQRSIIVRKTDSLST